MLPVSMSRATDPRKAPDSSNALSKYGSERSERSPRGIAAPSQLTVFRRGQRNVATVGRAQPGFLIPSVCSVRSSMEACPPVAACWSAPATFEPRAAFRRVTGSDMGALPDQTVVNIREWAGRRKRGVLSEREDGHLRTMGVSVEWMFHKRCGAPAHRRDERRIAKRFVAQSWGPIPTGDDFLAFSSRDRWDGEAPMS